MDLKTTSLILIFLVFLLGITAVSASEITVSDNLTSWELDDNGNVVNVDCDDFAFPLINTTFDYNRYADDLRKKVNMSVDDINASGTVSSPVSIMSSDNHSYVDWGSFDYNSGGSVIDLTNYKYNNGGCNNKYFIPFLGSNSPNLIRSDNFETFYSQGNYYTAQIFNVIGKPVGKNVDVAFKLNGKTYNVKTDSNGVAKLKFSLKPGKYSITVSAGRIDSSAKIVVKSPLKTKNVSKKYKKSAKFTVKLVNKKGKVFPKQLIKIKFKGKLYSYKTNSKGIVTFKIPKNLKKGKYTIKTTYKGFTVKNKITVK